MPELYALSEPNGTTDPVRYTEEWKEYAGRTTFQKDDMKAFRITIVLGIGLLVLSATILPRLTRAKIGGGPSCTLSLRLIQQAKSMYAQDHPGTNTLALTREQLLPYGFGGKWPQCPAGGQYSIGTLHESPRCSYPAHATLRVPVD